MGNDVKRQEMMKREKSTPLAASLSVCVVVVLYDVYS